MWPPAAYKEISLQLRMVQSLQESHNYADVRLQAEQQCTSVFRINVLSRLIIGSFNYRTAQRQIQSTVNIKIFSWQKQIYVFLIVTDVWIVNTESHMCLRCPLLKWNCSSYEYFLAVGKQKQQVWEANWKWHTVKGFSLQCWVLFIWSCLIKCP